jgi:hypothetical protein
VNFENIVFNHLDIPYIKDFSQSFDLSNIDEERKNILFSNKSLMPLEWKICTFLHNYEGNLSKNNIEEISLFFFEELSRIFDFIEEKDFIPFYLETTNSIPSISDINRELLNEKWFKKYMDFKVFSLHSYINKPKDVVINDLLVNCATYLDLYFLCLTYLLLIREFIKNELDCHFIEDFSLLLYHFIMELCLKRESDILDENLFDRFHKDFEKMIEKCDFDDLL